MPINDSGMLMADICIVCGNGRQLAVEAGPVGVALQLIICEACSVEVARMPLTEPDPEDGRTFLEEFWGHLGEAGIEILVEERLRAAREIAGAKAERPTRGCAADCFCHDGEMTDET